MDGQKSRRRTAVALWIADAAVFCVSVAVAVALLLSYAAPYVNPNATGWLAFAGLAAPFLYVGNIVLLLYWTVRWKPVAFFLAAVALLGVGHVTKFYRPQIGRTYEQPRVAGTFRVLSYNVEGFFGRDSLGKRENRMDTVAAFIREMDPDVVCLQEFETNYLNPPERFDGALEAWKYKQLFLETDEQKRSGRGLAVYSKYPLLRRGGIRYPDSRNSSMWVDVAIHRDTLRVYNNHLQSTQVSEDDREYLGAMTKLADTLTDERAKSILRKLDRNFKVRATQADSVARFIHDGRPRVVVCGDFNDTPMSYTYRRMRGDLVDAFSRRGHGAINTYRGLLGVFRIDYLFHSDDMETVAYDSELPLWSDHNPVIVDLKFRSR